MNKTIGYALSGLGLLGIVIWTFPTTKTYLQGIVAIPTYVTDTIILVVSLALLGVGAFFVTKAGGSRSTHKNTEVPIFKGKEIIGYRRH